MPIRKAMRLYHSLQVFELARQELPYDEEFLLAALLHDVGKAIDPRDHVAAALEVLEGLITPRTAWLIEHHEEALTYSRGTLGARLRRRLQAAEDFDELHAAGPMRSRRPAGRHGRARRAGRLAVSSRVGRDVRGVRH